ncbi:hypothetical protein PVAND_010444 [Polypedilum vanderplanki]|uniref:Uncharacterized protein n=1 Tax=Polypedilum vanderplanki TaxID=319348 RepID=A0A9J6CFN3_POLVA|nr:hypothetical protein PVAND_010444 [Polypedilum vanderplanki]
MGRKQKIKQLKKAAIKKYDEIYESFMIYNYEKEADLINAIKVIKKANNEMKKLLPQHKLVELEEYLANEIETEIQEEYEEKEEDNDPFSAFLMEIMKTQCCQFCRLNADPREIKEFLDDFMNPQFGLDEWHKKYKILNFR